MKLLHFFKTKKGVILCTEQIHGRSTFYTPLVYLIAIEYSVEQAPVSHLQF
jgi:hypothetical protein